MERLESQADWIADCTLKCAPHKEMRGRGGDEERGEEMGRRGDY
jgi:hypothetical protein